MDQEKFNSIIQYYNDLSIEVPIAVQNALKDVFEENDNIESVESYFREDLEELKKLMHLKTDVKLFMSGQHTGSITNTWTYYGSTEFTADEVVTLCSKDGEEIDKLVCAKSNLDGDIYDPEDWAVLLFETVSWDTNESNEQKVENPKLILYCPKFLDETDGDDEVEYAEEY